MNARSRPLVIASVETPEGDRCVDIFERPDGSFGFEGYRRDVEALGGWFPISACAEQRYPTAAAAQAAAARLFPWVRCGA